MQSIVCRNPDIVTNEIDGNIVMMSISEGTFFGLHDVGSAIWYLVENPTTIENIIIHILEKFDVSKEQCQSDILRFIEAMIEKKTLILKMWKMVLFMSG